MKKTSTRLRLYKSLLKSKPSTRSKYIHSVNERNLNILCEIFTNLIRKKFPCSKIAKHRLVKYDSEIRMLANNQSPALKRRKILASVRGGYLLNILLPIATSFLSTILK